MHGISADIRSVLYVRWSKLLLNGYRKFRSVGLHETYLPIHLICQYNYSITIMQLIFLVFLEVGVLPKWDRLLWQPRKRERMHWKPNKGKHNFEVFFIGYSDNEK